MAGRCCADTPAAGQSNPISRTRMRRTQLALVTGNPPESPSSRRPCLSSGQFVSPDDELTIDPSCADFTLEFLLTLSEVQTEAAKSACNRRRTNKSAFRLKEEL